MIRLAEHDLCTGCGACAFKCPKSCITMKEDSYGIVLPYLDSGKCVECHACEKVCPVLNPPSSSEPEIAYAAWSNDPEERRTSASGGIAIEVYKYAISQGWYAVGASQNNDFSVTHKVVHTEQELQPFKNSKYVFSDTYDAFPKIKDLLKSGEKVVFIGLPCQVAALKKLFNNHDNLLLIDLVCHGATPLSYLRQHIHYLESREGREAKRMSFRDPDTYTYTYTFTLYDKDGRRFYAKRTKDGDTYQYGYHRSISYRENCYHCKFARRQRVSDITLSDYNGLGKMAPCEYNHLKVSCILCNTDRRQTFVNDVIQSGRIHADVRPVEEPISADARLRMPTQKSKARLDFEKVFVESGNSFEDAMTVVIKRDLRRIKIRKALAMPKKLLKKIYRLIK